MQGVLLQERLDPKIKAIKAEELVGLKQELEKHAHQELERKYAKRYHHVGHRGELAHGRPLAGPRMATVCLHFA